MNANQFVVGTAVVLSPVRPPILKIKTFQVHYGHMLKCRNISYIITLFIFLAQFFVATKIDRKKIVGFGCSCFLHYSCLWLGTQEKHKMKNKEKRPKRFADKPVQSFSSSFLLATITTHLILRICVCLHFASFWMANGLERVYLKPYHKMYCTTIHIYQQHHYPKLFLFLSFFLSDIYFTWVL